MNPLEQARTLIAGTTRIVGFTGTGFSTASLHQRAGMGRRVEAGDAAPRCRCGGLLKPATILFGEPMPPGVMARAEAVVDHCDLLLVAGSSLEVEPAVVRGEIGVVLPALVRFHDDPALGGQEPH